MSDNFQLCFIFQFTQTTHTSFTPENDWKMKHGNPRNATRTLTSHEMTTRNPFTTRKPEKKAS